jgi:hypothetical protein
MLPEKLVSMVSARDELAAAAVSTPRFIARVRGKALHYGCAIPFIRVAVPSLSQLMHNLETGKGPVAVPSLDDHPTMRRRWNLTGRDRELRVSEQARRALKFMCKAMEKYGDVGQPSPSGLWCRACSTGRSWRARKHPGHHLRR